MAISDRRFSLYLIAILRIQLRLEYLNSMDLKNESMDPLRGLAFFSVNFELFYNYLRRKFLPTEMDSNRALA